MKKKSLLFLLYSVIAVVTIILLLVFVPKIKNKIERDDNNTAPSTEDVGNYATYFDLNLPTNINIFVGTTINLSNSYFSIIPSSMESSITNYIEVIDGVYNGITFDDYVISGNTIGTYKITFSVPSSASSSFNKSIYVNVHNNLDLAHVSLIKSSIIINETNSVLDLFKFNSNSTYVLTSSDNINCSNDIIVGKMVGNGLLNFKFVENNIQYNYQFELNVKYVPEYKIVVNDIDNNTIALSENESFFLNYLVFNRDDEKVTYNIQALSFDEDIVRVDNVMNPLVKLKALAKGETTIRLMLEDDSSIHIDLIVIVY